MQSPGLALTQVLLPLLQIPTVAGGPHRATVPSMQAQPPLGVPSQSESSAGTVQLSCGTGATAPMHSLQSLLCLSGEIKQVRSPGTQGPWLSNPGCGSHASFASGLQRQ